MTELETFTQKLGDCLSPRQYVNLITSVSSSVMLIVSTDKAYSDACLVLGIMGCDYVLNQIPSLSTTVERNVRITPQASRTQR
jgi:hypothetical protein